MAADFTKGLVHLDGQMKAFCGTYCGACEWKEKTNCPGCRACQGEMFWGQCDKAQCCMDRGYEHCGLCPDAPCQKLQDLFADLEHGDGGARMNNLRNWARGVETYEKLR